MLKFLSLTLLLFVLISCEKGSLRGNAELSKDGKTYLVIQDDNGGACGSITLDGKVWPHPIDVQGEVAPGTHIINCGGSIEFIIKPSTIFYFDYWGP
jgi:hypothetical protein